MNQFTEPRHANQGAALIVLVDVFNDEPRHRPSVRRMNPGDKGANWHLFPVSRADMNTRYTITDAGSAALQASGVPVVG